MVGRCGSAIKKLRIVTLRFGSDRKWSLNDGQIPNVRGVRVHVRTGYHRVEGNRRASRNGPDLSHPNPLNDSQTFSIAVGGGGARAAHGGRRPAGAAAALGRRGAASRAGGEDGRSLRHDGAGAGEPLVWRTVKS